MNAPINLLPKPFEMMEMSIQFNEAHKMFGYHAVVMIPKDVNLPDEGFQLDVAYDEFDKFDAWISLEPHPTTKMLQKYGWDNETSDNKPLTCTMARWVQPHEELTRQVLTSDPIEIMPQRYTRLVLDYDYFDFGREFIVTRTTSHSFNPIYYVMLLLPYRPRIVGNTDPLQDNNMTMIDIQETNSKSGSDDFHFLNIPNAPRSNPVAVKF